MKMVKAFAAVVAASLAFVGCNSKSSTIKIGSIGPLSGNYAVYGGDCKNGIELAVNEINAAGGVNGQLLELIAEDDEGQPEKSVSAYKKLVTKDGVKLVVGSLTSGCAIAITPLAQAQKVVQIAPAATAPAVTDAGNFIFRACYDDPFQGTVGGKFAAENLGTKNAAILYDIGNDYSVGLTENFKTAFEKAGGSIVSLESYSTGDKDFNAQLTKIKNANPDVVYLPDYYSTLALIVKQLRAQGINTPIVGADGWDGLTENAGDEVLNGFYSNHYAADSTESKAESEPSDSADAGEAKGEKSSEERIAELEKENADLKDQLLHRAADFDNYRKRMMQEKQDAFDYGNANLLKDLLDSLDNFDRTLDAAKDAKDAKSIADGIKMINKSLVSMLENKYNLVSFGKEGDAFDPDLHEAIGMQEGKVKKEELAAVYLKGYKLKDKVIRHAKVMVVKPAE